MSEKSAIEWTDATWNPVLGCSKVSQGCRGCYAILQAHMKQSNPHPKVRAAYAGLVEKRADGSLNWTGKVRMLNERLEIPLRWKAPKKIFVNSLSDLFHPDVDEKFIAKCFAIMALTPRHTYQVLTKRPERMAQLLSDEDFVFHVGWLEGQANRELGLNLDLDTLPTMTPNGVYTGLPNVWLGTSVEDQKAADDRIPHLLATPAAVRFLSCEPLLGPVDLSRWIEPTLICKSCDAQYGLDEMVPDTEGNPPHIHGADQCADCGRQGSMISVWGEQGLEEENTGSYLDNDEERDYGYKLSWIITGGESGPNARPMHPDWARSLRDQCQAAGVSFFFKEWGEWLPGIVTANDLAARHQDGSDNGHQGKRDHWWTGVHMSNHPGGSSDGLISTRVGRHKSGRLLDGREWNDFPTVTRAT